MPPVRARTHTTLYTLLCFPDCILIKLTPPPPPPPPPTNLPAPTYTDGPANNGVGVSVHRVCSIFRCLRSYDRHLYSIHALINIRDRHLYAATRHVFVHTYYIYTYVLHISVCITYIYVRITYVRTYYTYSLCVCMCM